MKILIAHNHYQQAGGEDESFKAEVAALREGGHEVLEYAVHNDAINGMTKLDVAARTLWNRATYQDLRGLIRRERPQVVHFNNTFPLISPAAYYAAKAEGVPVVQALRNYRLLCPGSLFFRDGKTCEKCLHQCVPVSSIVHGCYRGSRAATATVAAMLTVHRAVRTWDRVVDVYVALTEFAKRKFVEGGFPAEKLIVKPNFVHPDPGIGQGTGGYAVFLGRLAPEKGVGTMLKAWETLGARIPLKIIGSGPLEAEVRAAAARIPGVEYVGKRPPREAYEIVGGATFLVFPSEWYETFGRVAVEAFAKGTPVLASDLGAMAELITPGRTGLLFRPGDPADLVRQADALLSDPAKLARMREDCRREFDLKYTARQNTRRMLEIYHLAMRHTTHAERLAPVPPLRPTPAA